MNEERRKYIFAQLNSLPNASQYVEVTNYIKQIEEQNAELKEENFKLKLQKDTNNCALAILNDKIQKENERLKNNWNELKEHCNTMLSIFEKMNDKNKQEQLDKYVIYDKFLSKMQEIEEKEM